MIETEIKLRIDEGAEGAIRLLEQHGYRMRSPRALQIDQVYDLPDGAMRRNGKLLRIRTSDGVATLTYKGPGLASRHKSREELEATTRDSEALAEILDRLGYAPSFRYEKYRTVFADGETSGRALIAVDETPIGVFMELEGPADWIDHTANRLGFAPHDYITASYASLYQQHLKHHAGPADMIFAPGSQRDDTNE
jgi:adenylate cyclase class 2